MGAATARAEKWWQENMAPYVKIGVIVLVAIGVIVAGMFAATSFADKRAEAWGADLSPALIQDTMQDWGGAVQGSHLEQTRLKDQMTLVRSRLKHHSSLMVYFYGRQFMVITIATVCAVIAAALLIVITQKGWATTPVILRAFFLLAGTGAALFASFPALYRQEQNILDNAALYQGYLALRNEMLSYLATGQRLSGKKEPLPQFIHYVDSGLVNLGKVAIGFDASKIPDGGDLLKQIK
jgi:hypothetical protein